MSDEEDFDDSVREGMVVSRKALSLIKLRKRLALLKRQVARMEPKLQYSNSRLEVLKAEIETVVMKIRMVEGSLKEHQRGDYELLKARAVAEAVMTPNGGKDE